MSDLIDRQAAIDALRYAQHRFTVADEAGGMGTVKWSEDVIYFAAAERVLTDLPSAQLTLRERALMLLLNWAVECDFGYDNFPEEYERYKDEIEDMGYIDGMIYIAEKEVERNG